MRKYLLLPTLFMGGMFISVVSHSYQPLQFGNSQPTAYNILVPEAGSYWPMSYMFFPFCAFVFMLLLSPSQTTWRRIAIFTFAAQGAIALPVHLHVVISRPDAWPTSWHTLPDGTDPVVPAWLKYIHFVVSSCIGAASVVIIGLLVFSAMDKLDTIMWGYCRVYSAATALNILPLFCVYDLTLLHVDASVVVRWFTMFSWIATAAFFTPSKRTAWQQRIHQTDGEKAVHLV